MMFYNIKDDLINLDNVSKISYDEDSTYLKIEFLKGEVIEEKIPMEKNEYLKIKSDLLKLSQK